MKDATQLVRRLNGRIYLISGNHDGDGVENAYESFAKETLYQNKFDICPNLFEVDIQVEDEKLRFVLCHYAMRVWNKSHYGAIHLYGHSHGTLPDDPKTRSMDVGIDTYNIKDDNNVVRRYMPYHLDEILLAMYRKVYKPVDHHGKR